MTNLKKLQVQLDIMEAKVDNLETSIETLKSQAKDMVELWDEQTKLNRSFINDHK